MGVDGYFGRGKIGIGVVGVVVERASGVALDLVGCAVDGTFLCRAVVEGDGDGSFFTRSAFVKGNCEGMNELACEVLGSE